MLKAVISHPIYNCM